MTPDQHHQRWMDDAACRGVDPIVFYPPWSNRRQFNPKLVGQARAICDRCPVSTECLDYAVANGELDGIWGGTTPRERKVRPRRQCSWCSTWFTIDYPNHRLCSDDCRHASRLATQNRYHRRIAQ